MGDRSWSEPGVQDVGHGVHRIPLPLPNDGLRAVNVYAVADGDSVVLVDSGWALDASRRQLETSLDAIGYRLHDVSEFLVTHIHRDHYTQAVAIRRELGTPVSLGEGERQGLELILGPHGGTVRTRQADRLVLAGAFDLAARVQTAPMDGDISDWALPDGWLRTGMQLALSTRMLRVVETPGHTRGHVVFYDDTAQALFAGDHVLPHITPSICFEPVWRSSSLADYLDSLTLVRSMPDVRLLPAHVPVADTAWAVARALRWTRHERRFDDLDPFNQMLATTETMAHLDVLVAAGCQ